MPKPSPFGHRYTLLFVALFALFCSVLEYGRVLHLRPQPHHIWRQTIALSITRNYYDRDLAFLDTQVNNLYLDQGWSGKAAAEFPVLYYGIAKLWTLTGRSEFAYRLVMLVLHFLGSLALFQVLRCVFRDGLLPVLLALLFLTSPALVYFAIGFMTEVPALDLVLLGAWALARHREREDFASLVAAVLLLTLAGLLKVTAAMFPLALLAVLMAEAVFRPAPGSELFTRRKAWAAVWMLCGLVVIWRWVAYTQQYNVLHHGSFSHQEVQPFWAISEDLFRTSWSFGSSLLPGMVYHWSLWLLFGGCAVVVAYHARRIPPGVLVLNATLLGGTLLYILLFFPALNEHDYYFIVPLVMPWVLAVTAFWALDRIHVGTVRSTKALLGIAVLLLVNAAYAREDHVMRTRGPMDLDAEGTFPLHNDAQQVYWQESQHWSRGLLLDIEPYARSIGITAQDTVICVPDASVCASLYLAGQLGWQNFGTLHDLNDSLSMAFYRDRGAKYLYVIEAEWLERPYMKTFTKHPVGEHLGVKIYDLRGRP